MDSFSLTSTSPAQTGRIAEVVAHRLFPGDAVLLSGDLAAGKTTFVKGVAAALGSTDLVTSPTFTLAQFYRAGPRSILHIDTYRLADLAEYGDLSLEEYVDEAITLVEWGDLVASRFPEHLAISFRPAPDAVEARALAFSSSSERWTSEFAGMRDEMLGGIA